MKEFLVEVLTPLVAILLGIIGIVASTTAFWVFCMWIFHFAKIIMP